MTMRNANGKVGVQVPPGMSITHVHVPGDPVTLRHDGGYETITDAHPVIDGAIWLSPASALDWLSSPEPSTLPWREANATLLAALEAKAKQENYVPRNRLQGIRIVDLLQAVEDRPPTLREEMARFRQARDAGLREMLRARGSR